MSENKLFEPINDRLIIKPFSFSNTTAHGVILPDVAQEALNIGKIVSIGPGTVLSDGTYKKLQCKIDDIVVFPKYGAFHFEVAEEQFLAIREQDVITILLDHSVLDKLNLNIIIDDEE